MNAIHKTKKVLAYMIALALIIGLYAACFRHLNRKEIGTSPAGAYFFCQILENKCCIMLYGVV